MAQYYWDAEAYDVDDVPSDAWAIRGGSGNFVIKLDGSGRKYMEVDVSGSSRRAFEFLLAPAYEDGELYGEFMAVAGATDMSLGSRASNLDDPSTFNGLRADYLPDANSDRLAEYLDGNFSNLGAKPITTPVGTLASVRQEVSGTTLRGRWWNTGDAEPGVWGLESSAAVGTTGKPVIFTFKTSSARVYAFGIGTDGDPAPTEPVDDGGGEQKTFDVSVSVNTASHTVSTKKSNFSGQTSSIITQQNNLTKSIDLPINNQLFLTGSVDKEKVSIFSPNVALDIATLSSITKSASFEAQNLLSVTQRAALDSLEIKEFSATVGMRLLSASEMVKTSAYQASVDAELSSSLLATKVSSLEAKPLLLSTSVDTDFAKKISYQALEDVFVRQSALLSKRGIVSLEDSVFFDNQVEFNKSSLLSVEHVLDLSQTVGVIKVSYLSPHVGFVISQRALQGLLATPPTFVVANTDVRSLVTIPEQRVKTTITLRRIDV